MNDKKRPGQPKKFEDKELKALEFSRRIFKKMSNA